MPEDANLSTAPVTPPTSNDDSSAGQPLSRSEKRKSKRRQTSHLKKAPATKALREEIRAQCYKAIEKVGKARPLSKEEMESTARGILAELAQPESYVGWTMVMLATAFWQDQVAAVPPERRLFLLPHCLKHAEGCPADYDQFGLDCKTCGACSIADFRTAAEEMGYKVLVAEGTPIVLKIIISGYVDAICGVACLNVLEKAIDKILLAGIPCMAVPLLSSDCRNTSVDEDWVHEMINVQPAESAVATQSYLHLMRAAANMFHPDELDRLAPRARGGKRLAEVNGQGIGGIDPIAGTEAVAYDFLAKGGKHSRPFITLAVYDALTGGRGASADGAAQIAAFPDAVKRAALSIETFHKASLVHDDIEDNDAYRYGAETLHRQYGVATAINVGDYLIGLGYRLVSREAAAVGGDVVADILDCLADSHMRLSEGQGAELLWRDSRNKRLAPIDALKIYALKTSPAFEAAFFCGARMAGETTAFADPIRKFARNLGVAFQILNDLKDWQGDSDNKLAAGGDILGGRPTILWALALEGLSTEKQQELESLISDETRNPHWRVEQVRRLYQEADVFEKAHRLVDKHQQRAEAIADEMEPEELRRLMYYLIDTVLERGEEVAPTIEITPSFGNASVLLK
ncbi:polyprenyl synthetase family protein [Lignipirellula cremea]|uniref:All-trans-nonaprenyl-diphosphate synthase (Geranyl-diphosphate specific) n=1 Tax=Lignipirellula cremea TaxID=2528010 RepID=A0A518DR38_9BACT|nr:polyprenyl synthetase family protein [Lignipirellula cremea]QDU94303.1 All-trans-nonaprenyl-diphosphate synthase (geranyl-diphosphate specific) [Lignipirellula cremea]